jgi:hypothetical protein
MKAIITLIMRGRLQATIAMVLFVMLALLFSPMVIASAAIVALATLHNGAREGLLVAGAGLLSLAVLSTLSFQAPLVLVLPGVLLWIPAWGLAELLRQGRSLANVLEVTLIGGWVLVGLQYLWLDSPAEFWRDLLQQVFQTHFDTITLTADQETTLLEALIIWMPGAVAASWFLICAMMILLTLWASATLQGTDQFAQTFRALRCSRSWLIVTPLLLIPSLISDAQPASLPSQLYLVSTLLFVLQGLSVLHSLAAHYQVRRFWLSGMYALLVFVAPYSINVMSMIGYIDGWWDIRARLKAISK